MKKNKDIILRKLFDFHVKNSRKGKVNTYLKYLYRSRNHYLINILIASFHFKEEGISYEKICKMLDYQFASRTTILNILDQGVECGFLRKKIDAKDHRKQNYNINVDAEEIINNWLDKHPFFEENNNK